MLFYSILIGSAAIANNTGQSNSTGNSNGTTVNEKLLRSFSERFPDAEQVAWQELPETYTVNFMEHGVRSHIVFDKQGGFISSTRYYQERNLPYYLLNILKKRFTGKTIFSVTEQTTGSGVEYFVKLEDDKVWLTIQMDSEGNLAVVEKYRKAI